MGGEIQVSSQLGKGSCFSLSVEVRDVTFDRGAASEIIDPGELGAEVSVPEGIRVLYADDGADNRKLVSLMLRKAKVELTLVKNGARAVESALEAHRAGILFDVILMDMQMPELDGYEATRLLRESGYESPIVALTANAMDEDRDRCGASGCDGFVAKPIARRELFLTLRIMALTSGERRAEASAVGRCRG